jgi:membrane protein insertase Oxa1/YidC/SpoIIIJ
MAQRELYSLQNMIVLKGVMQRLNVKIKSKKMKADKKSLLYQLKL